jgi:hypothetical protein
MEQQPTSRNRDSAARANKLEENSGDAHLTVIEMAKLTINSGVQPSATLLDVLGDEPPSCRSALARRGHEP